MKKVFLIDGSSVLSTCFYGNVPKEYLKCKTDEEYNVILPKLLQTKDGLYTNGIYGFCKILKKIEEKYNPEYLCVAWDLSRQTFRREFYSDYKANRSETRPELSTQFKQLQQLLEYVGIPSISLEGYEADDIIGTLAEKYKNEAEVIILTKDQDSIQLVDENVTVWLTTSKFEEICQCVEDIPSGAFEKTFPFNPKYVESYYGFKPINMIDYKALSGDASDNIPGIKGVGEKSAIALVQEYETVEKIMEVFSNASDEDIQKIKDTFKNKGVSRLPIKALLADINGEKMGEKSKFLATIKRDLPNMPELSDVKYEPNAEKRIKIYSRLEFNSLL